MKLTVRQLKRVIKEAVMDARKARKGGKSEEEKRAEEILFGLDRLHMHMGKKQFGSTMPWSEVIRNLANQGIETSKEEIEEMIATFKSSPHPIGHYIEGWSYTNQLQDDGIMIDDPRSI